MITKKAANDPFGIGADEPAYAGPLTASAILEEIYRQRCIELFMSGLKLEDMRRFERPVSERKRNFFLILSGNAITIPIRRPIRHFRWILMEDLNTGLPTEAAFLLWVNSTSLCTARLGLKN